ncbi:MAG: redoxin domain-containing protein [Chloroflexi bacterium]|nr:MAG: redoxin domain-containing protein [Chloroflexota bacterium]
MTEFRSRNDDAAAAGVGIYGISVDSVFSHQAFATELGGLPFDLIGDFERKMVTAYGVRRDDVEGYSGMAKRSVFVIDSQGVIRWAWERSREEPLPNYDQVIAEAKKVASAA